MNVDKLFQLAGRINQLWSPLSIAFAVGILLLAFPEALCWQTFDRSIQVLSALGTLAAVLAALQIANRTSIEAEGKAYRFATLTAAGIALQLDQAVKNLDASLNLSDFSEVLADEVPQYREQRERSNQNEAVLDWLRAASHSGFRLDATTVDALMPLPKHCAHRLKAGCATLSTVSAELEQVVKSGLWDSYGITYRRNLYTGWRQALGVALDQLLVASSVCMREGFLSTPKPSGQELYGDE